MIPKPLETRVILEKMAQHIGVRYIFQDSTVEEAPTVPQSDQAAAQLLKAMPQQWKERLVDACLGLNSEEVEILIAIAGNTDYL